MDEINSYRISELDSSITPIFEVSADKQRLRLYGTIVDTVQTLGHCGVVEHHYELKNTAFLGLQYDGHATRIHMQVFRVAVEMTRTVLEHKALPRQESAEAILHSISLTPSPAADPHLVQQAFHNWYRWIRFHGNFMRKTHVLNPAARGIPNVLFDLGVAFGDIFMFLYRLPAMLLRQQNLLTGIEWIMMYLQWRTARQRFAKTNGLLLGLVPYQTEVGDSLFICEGSHCPLIVRRKGTGWELIGAASFHELQDPRVVHERYSDKYTDIWLV